MNHIKIITLAAALALSACGPPLTPEQRQANMAALGIMANSLQQTGYQLQQQSYRRQYWAAQNTAQLNAMQQNYAIERQLMQINSNLNRMQLQNY